MDAPIKLSGAAKPFLMDGDQHIYEPADMWTAQADTPCNLGGIGVFTLSQCTHP